MPTYHYVCAKCGHEFDVFQSIKAKALTSCPKDQCPKKRWGKGRVQRQLSAGAGILFKGSGFYTTDYRSDSYKQAVKKESERTTPKTETTTAAKTEPKAASPAKPSTS